ncbi:predicted protein [Aspergillus terreus NIH2624]|uniref:Uncharacterized protein n=1 Tax=Aspergillus terreus (strain NIH 2624 / FGSC A1156) TaxID=341663 RepID=Q0CJH6_ASPTN|nr:uncharacterized protein ATEG_06158 [Aspergillus terreus NIH2624]EAU33919.1 predicted protein [Aspergillus terreus NIH2624]
MASTHGDDSSTPPAWAFPSFASSLSFSPPLLPFSPWSPALPFDMNDDPGVEFVAARPRKRSRRAMPPESSQSSRYQGPHPNGEPSSSRHPQPRESSLSLPPIRYPGDGYDYRRPLMSSPPQENEIIDLTNDPDSPPSTSGHSSRQQRRRPPRFARDILTEVVDLEDEGESQQIPPSRDAPSSPEVQFVGSAVRTEPLPPPPRRGFMGPMLQMLRYFPRHAAQGGSITQGYRWRGPRAEDIESFWIGDVGDGAVDLTIDLGGMDGRLGMDFQTPGVTPDRGRSTYKPPSPPPEGFTRSVGEEDIVCCPNCDAELGTGDEVKQQIWVAKQCGHVSTPIAYV